MTIFEIINKVNFFITHIFFPVFIILLLSISYFKWRKSHPNSKHLKLATPKKVHGIVFGKTKFRLMYSPAKNEGHIAIFGGSGLGKTSALLIPTLRSWPYTSFTIDISGDICKNVDIPNKLVYEPENPFSTPYNIFASIDCLETIDEQNEALEQLAFLMIPEDLQMRDAAKFFNTEGRKILTAALIGFYHIGMDFIPICEKIVSSSWRDLFNAIDDASRKSGCETASIYLSSFLGTNEVTTAGCKQSCDAAVNLFATNSKIKKSIRRPNTEEFSYFPQQLEKYNVFIVIEDSKLNLYSPLLHIITSQSLEYFSTRSNENKHTILFCLDEFASLGKIEITDALRKLRKKHIRIMLLTQSMADIDLIYGYAERMAMMNNFRFKVILGIDDADTQEYFTKLIGKEDDPQNPNIEKWAIKSSDLAHLGNYLLLLHPDGYIKLKKNFYFK